MFIYRVVVIFYRILESQCCGLQNTTSREILDVNPFTGTKQRTVQRGAKWDIVAKNLNKIQDIYFKVSQRSVRDRYNLLAKQLRVKLRKEESASGIETDMNEVERALQDIIEIEDASDQEQQEISDEKMEKENKDRADAETMRMKAMETLGQTKNRMCAEGQASKPVKRRSNGSDALNYLREKNQAMNEWRKEELELKRMKLEADSKKHEEFMQMILHQQQMQQQQQKQQNDLILALVAQMGQRK